MNQSVICEAIQEKNILEFNYNGHARTVEPHAHGISTKGNNCLRCYQVAGGSSSGKTTGWKMMKTDNISALSVSQENFSSPRNGYKKGDKHMSNIFCEL